MNNQDVESKFLRNSLKGNGIFSTVSGVAFVVMSRSISDFLGIGMPWLVAVIGVSLLVFAAGLFRNALSEKVNLTEARLAIAMDGLWVVGSVIVIALGVLTTGGNWGTAIVADIVFVFAVLQFIGLRKASGTTT